MDTNKLEDTVNTILKDAINKAAQGAEFLKEQVPDVVQQLLRWKFWEAFGYGALEFIIILISLYAGIKCAKWAFKNDEWDTPLPLLPFFPCIILVPAFNNFMTCLQIYVAPKVWLLEYAARLVK